MATARKAPVGARVARTKSTEASKPATAPAAVKKATPAKAAKAAPVAEQVKTPKKAATNAKPKSAKPAKPTKPAKSATEKPAAAGAKTEALAPGKAAKPKKQKLVRDSFTMPESEYALLGEVKKACIANGFAVKKSELLRVGVALIRTLDQSSLKTWIESLPPLRPGRPRKEIQAA